MFVVKSEESMVCTGRFYGQKAIETLENTEKTNIVEKEVIFIVIKEVIFHSHISI